MNASMTREEAEQAYRRLVGVRDRLAHKLVSEVEGHDGLRHLKDHRLAGHTLRLWHDLNPDIVRMGAQYQALERHIVAVEGVRERRDLSGGARLAQLSDMLRSPTVRLRGDGTPTYETTSPVAETISLDALCERVEALGDDIQARLRVVDAAAKSVLARLSALADGLSQLATRASRLGPQQPVHEDLVDRYKRVSVQALDDPIGWAGIDGGQAANEPQLGRLETEVAEARSALDALHEIARTAPQRIDALRATVEAVHAAEARAETTCAQARHKVVGAGLELPAGQGSALRAAFEQVQQHRLAHRWSEVAAGLAATERAAREALDAAGERGAAAQALLDRRDQLRGRLDGYRAKAGRLGIDERAELVEAYRTARNQLWRAPCDLSAAAEAVWRYQDLVANQPRHDGGANR